MLRLFSILALWAAALGWAVTVDLSDPTVTGGVHLGADSTLTLGTKVFASGLLTTDTVRYDYYAGTKLLRTKRLTRLVDSLPAQAAPAYGATLVYQGCIQIERGGRTGLKFPAAPACWTQSFTRTAPTPVIDSVVPLVKIVLMPPTVSLYTPKVTLDPTKLTDTLSQKYLCAFGIEPDGTKVKLKNSWNRPECEATYQSWRASVSI
jgi:hypothetical protein